MNKSVNTFFNLTNVLYYNLLKKEEAINKIEQYLIFHYLTIPQIRMQEYSLHLRWFLVLSQFF